MTKFYRPGNNYEQHFKNLYGFGDFASIKKILFLPKIVKQKSHNTVGWHKQLTRFSCMYF